MRKNRRSLTLDNFMSGHLWVCEAADVYVTAVLEGLAVDVLAFVSRKYSSNPMITGEMVKEGIRSSIHHPI